MARSLMTTTARVERARAAVVASLFVLAGMTASHAQIRVRDVDNPARQTFQFAQSNVVVPASDPTVLAVANVPQGKRLVIEHVSLTGLSGFVQPGNTPAVAELLASLRTSTNGVVADHALVVNRVDNSRLRSPLSDAFVASQPMRAYADPGTEVALVVTPLSENRDGFVVNRLAVIGYFLDLNPP